MSRNAVMLACGLALTCAVGAAPGPQTAPASAPTFTRDIAPILYTQCVECHRAGAMAPMPLVTFREVRPWARAIDRRVADGSMPPWHAHAPRGTFRNERILTPGEKDLIHRWAEAGAPEGDPADLPAPPAFADGWRIGAPDAVFEMPEDYPVPATGTIEYEHFYIPTGFAEVKWLQAIDVRPGNPALVHHVLVYYEAPPDGGRGDPVLVPNRQDNRLPPSRPGNRPERGSRLPTQLLATYAPGTNPQVFPEGAALRLAPGGTLHLELHYTATGTAGTDRTRVGMTFAAQPPDEELRASQFFNARFTIPAGAPDHEVETDVTFARDATLWGLFPHTHVRGKRWSYVLELPDGTTRSLLSVPRYDFNWQTYYVFREPIRLPAGARIRSTAWYDNSASNRSNPDATLDVRWGDQTWEEMQYTGVLYSVTRR